MNVFVDTSALLAVLDAQDGNHPKAAKTWERLVSGNDALISSNYILAETIALIQHRLGMEAVREFQENVVPMLTVEWIDEPAHHAGVMGVMTAGRKKLSLVDCASFNVMRQMGIRSAFSFDRHFKQQGFECIP
ncbi:MAG: PIN domain-containing protein [Pseudomonadota bacterium]